MSIENVAFAWGNIKANATNIGKILIQENNI
jgi:hypothetical protein